MQEEKHKYTPQWYKLNLYEPLKIWPKGAKWSLKRGILGAKSELLGLKNYELATKLEGLNGAKCRFFRKNRQVRRQEKQEKVVVYLLFKLYSR